MMLFSIRIALQMSFSRVYHLTWRVSSRKNTTTLRNDLPCIQLIWVFRSDQNKLRPTSIIFARNFCPHSSRKYGNVYGSFAGNPFISLLIRRRRTRKNNKNRLKYSKALSAAGQHYFDQQRSVAVTTVL